MLTSLRSACISAALLLGSACALADTKVFVTNLTGEVLSVASPRVEGGLATSAWSWRAATVQPGARTEVLRFNRAEDVKNGRSYSFATAVRGSGFEFELRQLMRGTLFKSKMWWSLAGPGVAHPWYDEHGARTLTLQRPERGDRIATTYGAYFTGGYDDIEYVIVQGENMPAPAVDTPDSFSLVAWNVQFLPEHILDKAQAKRVAPLIAAINAAPRYDAIVFSEAFDESVSDKLFAGIAARYPYRTTKVGEDGLIRQDGGVTIASRYPIALEREIIYDDCSSSDCLARKGAVYARISKHGRPYHVFGTHLQAHSQPANVASRRSQMLALRGMIDSLALPGSEPVLIAGDMNVAWITGSEPEYQSMLTILQASDPPRGVATLATDWHFNGMTGRGGARKILDYTLSSRSHLAPLSAETRAVHARASAGYQHKLNDIHFHLDLSDHFPVVGVFQFPPRAP